MTSTSLAQWSPTFLAPGTGFAEDNFFTTRGWVRRVGGVVSGFPGGSDGAVRETWVQSLDGEDPLEKEMIPTPIFLPGRAHGRSLAGYLSWGCRV